jgi:hypothetical protein
MRHCHLEVCALLEKFGGKAQKSAPAAPKPAAKAATRKPGKV